MRTYWKNYFEKTDTLIWVVDSTDGARLGDCRDELHKLLLEEVTAFLHLMKPFRMLTHAPIAIDGSQLAGLQEQERCDSLASLY